MVTRKTDRTTKADRATDLREHQTEKVTLNDLAWSTRLSARTLSQRVVTELGFSPMRYLIEPAPGSLDETPPSHRSHDHTITQIAEECGFSNRYYFTLTLAAYGKTTPAVLQSDAR